MWLDKGGKENWKARGMKAREGYWRMEYVEQDGFNYFKTSFANFTAL